MPILGGTCLCRRELDDQTTCGLRNAGWGSSWFNKWMLLKSFACVSVVSIRGRCHDWVQRVNRPSPCIPVVCWHAVSSCALADYAW